jgi:hypothetical protein
VLRGFVLFHRDELAPFHRPNCITVLTGKAAFAEYRIAEDQSVGYARYFPMGLGRARLATKPHERKASGTRVPADIRHNGNQFFRALAERCILASLRNPAMRDCFRRASRGSLRLIVELRAV